LQKSQFPVGSARRSNGGHTRDSQSTG